jgi:hypothetical protein
MKPRIGMPRVGWSTGVAMALALLALLPATALGGEFDFSQCGPDGTSLDGQYSRLGAVDRVDVRAGCRRGGQDRLGVYQDRRGGSFREGEGGQYVWRAPAGLAVVSLAIRARLKDANGLRAAIAGRAGGSDVDLDGSLAHDGSVVVARWSSRSRPIDAVIVRLRCNRTGGCPNRASSVKSFFEVLGIELRVLDSRAPSLDGSGDLFATALEGRWLNGTVGYSVSAADVGSGLEGVALRVNGFPVPLDPPACAGLSRGRALGFSPCPPTALRTARLDTTSAPFQEGANRIEACAFDHAGSGGRPNTSCLAEATVMVDNREPPPPVDFRTDRDGSWSATPDVGVMWESTGDQGSGIALVRWKLVPAIGGAPVVSGSVPGSARSITVRVPQPGDFLLETRFVDQAGNVGPPAVARVRFDDIAPPPARPVVPDGWLSRDELPLLAGVDPVDPAGPSGIVGYALASSDLGPVAPCRSSACDPTELTLVDRPGTAPPVVDGLRDGVNWLSAVAVSGALVPSRSPVTTRVLVDRGYPDTTLDGVPSGWSREPVELVARATDGLSGMEGDPDDDGRPVTVIEVGGGETIESEGRRAEATITREGVSEVRFYARDLAGNVNDGRLGPGDERHPPPGVEQVKVDLTPPTAVFLGRPDPGRPELVRFEVADRVSGLASGTVLMTPSDPTGRKVELPSRLEGGMLEAEVHSDDLPPGEYELVARVTDRAGNRSASKAARLALPLKLPVTVSIGERTPGGRAVRGQVSLDGRPPGRAVALVVEEQFVPSAGREVRRTDLLSRSDGKFRVPVAPGPERTLRVLFAGTATEARAASRAVRVVDRDRVTFSVAGRSSRNGRTVRMRGRVSGPGFGPAGSGKGVVIQYFDPSRRRWRPVEVLTCSRDGRFRFGYRFTTITSPQRILFRAASLAESGWPFRPSASRKIAVVVRP